MLDQAGGDRTPHGVVAAPVGGGAQRGQGDGAGRVPRGDTGRIELSRLGGAVQARTDNGSVVATGLRSRSVTAGSRHGRVSLTFADPPTRSSPPRTTARSRSSSPTRPTPTGVELQTGNGSTDIGVRTDPASDRSIVADSDNGDVTVRYPTG